MNGPKILPQHLERQAYVYVRQSSQRQVEEHLESQDLQYQLTHRAQALGWPADQVLVIDDDLGKSAATATGREGFQALVAAVGLGQVGIILVTDVSRLARNCGDWYQLLDLASVCGTLLSDAGGVYDPRHYDDRLLLGLKGTFSEAQWYNMRTQLYTALLNKARRGELAIRLPIGYDRLEDGTVVWVPDREVQSAIRLVFGQFELLLLQLRPLSANVTAFMPTLPTSVQPVVPSGERSILKPISLVLLSAQFSRISLLDSAVAARLLGAAGGVRQASV